MAAYAYIWALHAALDNTLGLTNNTSTRWLPQNLVLNLCRDSCLYYLKAKIYVLRG